MLIIKANHNVNIIIRANSGTSIRILLESFRIFEKIIVRVNSGTSIGIR
jgi:hypothetical protein